MSKLPSSPKRRGIGCNMQFVPVLHIDYCFFYTLILFTFFTCAV